MTRPTSSTSSASSAARLGEVTTVFMMGLRLPLEMEVEILRRASAFFARENVLPK